MAAGWAASAASRPPFPVPRSPRERRAGAASLHRHGFRGGECGRVLPANPRMSRPPPFLTSVTAARDHVCGSRLARLPATRPSSGRAWRGTHAGRRPVPAPECPQLPIGLATALPPRVATRLSERPPRPARPTAHPARLPTRMVAQYPARDRDRQGESGTQRDGHNAQPGPMAAGHQCGRGRENQERERGMSAEADEIPSRGVPPRNHVQQLAQRCAAAHQHYGDQPPPGGTPGGRYGHQPGKQQRRARQQHSSIAKVGQYVPDMK